MNNILNWITLRIMKRMETQLGPRKKDLSEIPFFDTKIFKDCLPDGTIDQLLEFYGQAIRYNEHNLGVLERSICTIFFYIVSTDEKLLQNVSSSNRCKYKIVEAELYIEELFT